MGVNETPSTTPLARANGHSNRPPWYRQSSGRGGKNRYREATPTRSPEVQVFIGQLVRRLAPLRRRISLSQVGASSAAAGARGKGAMSTKPGRRLRPNKAMQETVSSGRRNISIALPISTTIPSPLLAESRLWRSRYPLRNRWTSRAPSPPRTEGEREPEKQNLSRPAQRTFMGLARYPVDSALGRRRGMRCYTTLKFLNCHGSVVSTSSGYKTPRSSSGVQSV